MLLDLAIMSGYAILVKALIESGVNIDKVRKFSLCCAAYKGNVEVVKVLVKTQVDINGANRLGYTPLHLAALRGHTEIVEILLASQADANKISRNGWTPLRLAAEFGYTEVINALLNRGADINMDVYYIHYSSASLFYIVKGSKIDVCELIVRHIEKLRTANVFISSRVLQLEAKINKEIFLCNHKPLVDALSTHYKRNFHVMEFTDIIAFFQKHKDDVILKLGNLRKCLINFMDFEEVHVPRLELCAFAQVIKNEILNKIYSSSKHQTIDQACSSSAEAQHASEITDIIGHYHNEHSNSLEDSSIQGFSRKDLQPSL